MVVVVVVVCQCELGEDWKGLRRDVGVQKERKTGASRDVAVSYTHLRAHETA